ncbi:universal stress protein [Halorubrum gandharaense]
MYRVVMPVDVDEERAESQVDTLLSLPAEPEELSVVLLHVHEEIDMPADEAGTRLIADLNRDIEELQGVPSSVEYVEDALADAGVETERRQVVAEETAEAILDVSGDVDADSLILGVRGRSPVGKAVFGSVTQAVILNSDRPVIVAPREE